VSSTISRRSAIVAIALAVGRRRSANVLDDQASGLTVIVDEGMATLELIEVKELGASSVWHFDRAPSRPTDSPPRWTGFLVHADPTGQPSVVPLGDRAAMVDRWPELNGFLPPGDLARVIARYFGRDAGLPVHHSAIPSVDGFRAALAKGEYAPSELAPPRLDLLEGGARLLAFWTSFVETTGPGPPTLGVAHWVARWAPEEALSWRVIAVHRGLRSREFSA
jgi:hypothetical protein